MRLFKAVLFDLDNTLYKNDEALETWAKESALELLTAVQIERLFGALPHIYPGSGGISLLQASDTSVLLQHIPNLTKDAIEFLTLARRRWLDPMALAPGAAELLDALKAKSIPFGIVTNAPTFQRIKIERLGLSTRSSCVLISDEFGAQKPDPRIFIAGAEQLKMQPADVLFVGDSPENDIVGAHTAGMRAAWIRDGREWPPELQADNPELVISNLEELLEYF